MAADVVARDSAEAAAGRFAVPLGLLVIALVAMYAGVLWALDALPFQDAPNHLSRAVAIADLLFDGGRRYGRLFTFEWQFVPYVLGDAIHAATLRVLPPDVAGRVWMIVAFASFPAATWLLLRQWGASPGRRAAGAALAIFLAADWFLRLGFVNFRYGLALVLVAVVAWERLVARPTVARAVLYAVAVVAGYLMHLSALLFTIVIVGTLSALRVLRDRGSFRRYAAAGLPLLAFLGWHLLFRADAELGASLQPPLFNKVLRIAGALAPTRQPFDVIVALGFVALVSLPLLAKLVRTRGRGWPWRAWEALALGVAFVAVYAVLPEFKGKVWGVDIRALPFIWLFASIALVLGAGARELRMVAIAALAIGTAHLLALGASLAPENARMRDYRRVAATVPAGARVLTVVTRPRTGAVAPTAHAGSWATLDARAVVPYTFTGDLDAPMPYFNFRVRPPPFPWQWWYVNENRTYLPAAAVQRYDYVLVEQPVDWRRLPAIIDRVRGNEAVVLAKVRHAPSLRTAEAAAAPR